MVRVRHDCRFAQVKLAARRPRLVSLPLLFLLLFSAHAPAPADEISEARQLTAARRMVEVIRDYGMTDPEILRIMESVPRHRFVPEENRNYSYHDTPLGIGFGQTISQPFIVAEMTRQLHLNRTSRVLEIGTGSGYQAAVLAELTRYVYSIEIIEPLHERAARTLAENGYQGVRLRLGDGYYGWPEAAPFDGIIVTCAAGHIPPPLIEQLAVGGRMIIPVGKRFGTQHLILVTKNPDRTITSTTLMAVRFVPLVRQ